MAWTSYLSSNPAKAAVERVFLGYTAVWGAVLGVVMLGGFAVHWRDWQLMLLGVSIFSGLVFAVLRFASPEELEKPWYRRTGIAILTHLTLYSFLMNYFGTRYFYELLGAHYGFQTSWNVNDVPFFLYLVTVAYFATYYALMTIGFRLLRARLEGRSRWLFRAAVVLLPCAIAFLESVLNANPTMKGLYCFDRPAFALWFGTILYGAWLGAVMPFWVRQEEPGGDSGLRKALLTALAATMLCLVCAEGIKWKVAPHYTSVKHGHVGLRDYGPGVCLEPPPGHRR